MLVNDPDLNYVLSMDIASNGQLSCGDAFYSFGRGGRGVSSPGAAPGNNTDALFSQGSIQVAGGLVAAVNSGSNTVALFSIDKALPSSISMIGGPVSSGGEFPNSVAISPDNTRACVVNSGAISGVQCFEVNPTRGLVTQSSTNRLIQLDQTTPPSGPQDTIGQVIYNEAGTQIIVSVKGGTASSQGYVATWDIASDGSLSTASTNTPVATGGALPFSLTLVPGQNAVFATDPAVGAAVYDFGANADSTATSSVIPIAGQLATCWSVYSNLTGHFYAVDSGSSTITEIALNEQLQGSIVKQYPLKSGSAPVDSTIVTVGGKE